MQDKCGCSDSGPESVNPRIDMPHLEFTWMRVCLIILHVSKQEVISSVAAPETKDKQML